MRNAEAHSIARRNATPRKAEAHNVARHKAITRKAKPHKRTPRKTTAIKTTFTLSQAPKSWLRLVKTRCLNAALATAQHMFWMPHAKLIAASFLLKNAKTYQMKSYFPSCVKSAVWGQKLQTALCFLALAGRLAHQLMFGLAE